MDLIENLKAMWIALITYTVSGFMHIGDAMFVLFIAFIINIITGIVADVNVNKKEFSLKKAFSAISQLLFFFALIFMLQIIGEHLNNIWVAKMGVVWISMIVIYFYFTNILRNAMLVFPKSQAISFLYEIFSTKIFDKLKAFFGIK